MTEVSNKLATIQYRERYAKAVAPVLHEINSDNAEMIDRYITKLYNENRLFPYSCVELIYTNDIPEGVDGSISREDIEKRMNTVINTDLGNVLPDNGRVLPFHPMISGYDIWKPLFVPGMDKFKDMMSKIKPGDGYIIVNGDYDVDGVSSQAIVINCLTAMGYMVKSIPNERRDGNGYNKTSDGKVKYLLDNHPGCKALILTDHGSGVDDVVRLEEINKRVPTAVIDHHKVGGATREVVTAFMNSRESEYQELSAGALAWQVMLYLGAPKDILKDMLPFAAITLITDVMDMEIWYTNLMYKEGIKLGREEPNQVLLTFLEALKGKNPLSEDIIGFNIGPILNAGHRMNNAAKSVALLSAPATVRNYEKEMQDSNVPVGDIIDRFIQAVLREVNGNYADLVNLNNMRKLKSARGLKLGEAAYAEYKKKYKFGAVLVLEKADENIIGIISSSIGNLYGVPTITLVKGGKIYVGSGRSIIRGLDCESICQNIKKSHPDVVVGGGGHPEAFGIRVGLDKAEEFKKLFSDALADHAHETKGLVAEEIPYTPYPLGVSQNDMLQDLMNHEPYGKVDKPHYSIMGKIEASVFGKNREHMNVKIGSNKALYFNGVRELDTTAEYIGMIVTVSPDTFRGGMQLIVDKLLRKESNGRDDT